MRINLQLPSGVRWSGMMVAGTLVAGVAAWEVAQYGVPLVVALFRPAADVKAVDTTTPLLTLHEQTHSLYRRRFEGRSLFFAPSDWKRKVPPPPPAPPAPPPPPPPPPPVDYTGPKPVGLFGTVVYFEGGRTVELGKEGDGVTVVEIVSPWQLKLRHKDRVYDVPVGNKPNDSLFKPLDSATTPSGLSPAPRGPVGGTAAPGGAMNAPAPGGPRGAPSAPQAAGDDATAGNPDPGAPALRASTGIPAPPAPLNAADVAKMDAPAAKAALARVDAALKVPGLEKAVSRRLTAERAVLAQRIGQLESAPAEPSKP